MISLPTQIYRPLLGSYAQIGNLPPNVWFWMAAVVGGTIGSTLGSKYFNSLTLRRVLAFVLLIASFKMFFT